MIALGVFLTLVLLVLPMVGLFLVFHANVPAYVGAVFCNRLTGRNRSVETGWRFRVPWLEYVAAQRSIKKRMLSEEMDAETQDELPVPLKFFLEWRPDPKRLDVHVSFGEEADIEKALEERFKSLATPIFRSKENFDKAYDELPTIAAQIHRDFTETRDGAGETLEEHYGIIVSAARFSDPAVPKKIADAKLDLEAMRKTNEKREIEMEMTNKLRGKEMTKLKSMANAWVKQAEKNGQKLDFQTALKIIQAQLGIIKESAETKGLNRDTLTTLEKLLPVIAKEIFNRDIPTEKLEQVLSKVIKEALDGRK